MRDGATYGGAFRGRIDGLASGPSASARSGRSRVTGHGREVASCFLFGGCRGILAACLVGAWAPSAFRPSSPLTWGRTTAPRHTQSLRTASGRSTSGSAAGTRVTSDNTRAATTAAITCSPASPVPGRIGTHLSVSLTSRSSSCGGVRPVSPKLRANFGIELVIGTSRRGARAFDRDRRPL